MNGLFLRTGAAVIGGGGGAATVRFVGSVEPPASLSFFPGGNTSSSLRGVCNSKLWFVSPWIDDGSNVFLFLVVVMVVVVVVVVVEVVVFFFFVIEGNELPRVGGCHSFTTALAWWLT